MQRRGSTQTDAAEPVDYRISVLRTRSTTDAARLPLALRHSDTFLEVEPVRLPEDEGVYRYCSAPDQVHLATTPCFALRGEGEAPGSSKGSAFALALEAHYKPFWYKTYPDETYYVALPANVRRQLLDVQAFFDLYLKGIPHHLADHGTRPLTRLSEVVGTGARSAQAGGNSTSATATPGRGVAS